MVEMIGEIIGMIVAAICILALIACMIVGFVSEYRSQKRQREEERKLRIREVEALEEIGARLEDLFWLGCIEEVEEHVSSN